MVQKDQANQDLVYDSLQALVTASANQKQTAESLYPVPGVLICIAVTVFVPRLSQISVGHPELHVCNLHTVMSILNWTIFLFKLFSSVHILLVGTAALLIELIAHVLIFIQSFVVNLNDLHKDLWRGNSSLQPNCMHRSQAIGINKHCILQHEQI